MSDGWKYLSRACATICIVPVTGTALVLASAAPAAAAPDLDQVRSKVDALSGTAHHAARRYHRAEVAAHHEQRRLKTVGAELARRQKSFDALRGQVASSVVFSPAAASTLTSASPAPPLAAAPGDRLTTLSQFDDRPSELLSQDAEQIQTLQKRQDLGVSRVHRFVGTAHRLHVRMARADRAAAKAEKLLSVVKERAAVQESRSAERTSDGTAPVAAQGSGRAAVAVAYALAQVGKAYVFGAAGPSAFDCSGLTMRAWQQAGVGLPHSSSAQTGSGQPVSESELRPGDLVFYYSPVSHVGMYIGNGQIVNAENPGAGVRITGVNSMPYAGAVRPG